jgi:hypothetical protein
MNQAISSNIMMKTQIKKIILSLRKLSTFIDIFYRSPNTRQI